MSIYQVDIQPDVDVPEALIVQLETAVVATLQHEKIPSSTLSLLLTGDEQVHQLNREFLDIDRPTDVLSFPAGEPMPGSAGRPRYLGDIALSVPYAQRQAAGRGHSLAAELQLLAVHGVLHLLGYDHARPEEKEKMWAAQAAVLAQLGLHQVIPGEEQDAS